MANEIHIREGTKKVRLIDANELLDKFQFRLPHEDEASLIVNDCVAIARKAIMEAQTVEAVPVVHGHWIDSTSVDHIGRITGHSIDCSVCDSVFEDDSREVVKHWKERFKVCPFCMALMDGGDEDG